MSKNAIGGYVPWDGVMAKLHKDTVIPVSQLEKITESYLNRNGIDESNIINCVESSVDEIVKVAKELILGEINKCKPVTRTKSSIDGNRPVGQLMLVIDGWEYRGQKYDKISQVMEDIGKRLRESFDTLV